MILYKKNIKSLTIDDRSQIVKLSHFNLFSRPLITIGNSKTLICTLNAHSFNIAQRDVLFREALLKSDVLIPDGISIAWSTRFLNGDRVKKIAGTDLLLYELERMQKSGGKCFFLGSTEKTLKMIKERASEDYPNVEIRYFSPLFKASFSEKDNLAMLDAINTFQPDVLFIGMTAPKQEKWAFQHFAKIQAKHVCCIGAAFDFYAGTVKRSPKWIINLGFEWLYRLVQEPRRMWRRYLIGNARFIGHILREKYVGEIN